MKQGHPLEIPIKAENPSCQQGKEQRSRQLQKHDFMNQKQYKTLMDSKLHSESYNSTIQKQRFMLEKDELKFTNYN